MDKYIYFVSQLPMLLFDKQPLIRIDDFLAEAEKWLTDTDYSILSRINLLSIEPEHDDPDVLRQYKERERAFQDELVSWRKTRGTEREYKPRLFSLGMLKEGTPLDAERLMLQWKWNDIDEEEHMHHFDLEYLVIYFLKLQILHRLMSFDGEQGLKKYHSVCEAET